MVHIDAVQVQLVYRRWDCVSRVGIMFLGLGLGLCLQVSAGGIGLVPLGLGLCLSQRGGGTALTRFTAS